VAAVQASVHAFDEHTGIGSVLLDDGRERWFSGEVFFESGLRHLRVGQRVSIVLTGDAVTRVWIVGIGEGQPIR
jgi:cold shock CspA family protein